METAVKGSRNKLEGRYVGCIMGKCFRTRYPYYLGQKLPSGLCANEFAWLLGRLE